MSDRITNTITEALRSCGVDDAHMVETPAVLAALKAERIAAVELPESAAIEVIGIEFWDGDGQEPVEAHITVAVPEEWEPTRDLKGFQTPDGMRVLAAVLLAQAEANEAVADA